ncbi:MAG: MarR family transcriptional regulator [Acidobacteriia bacterium]|nr:MarR family transcriptional regulator [Terriglobia bacterium]
MDLTLRDYQELAEFRYQLRHFLHFSELQARDHDLEPQQHQALLALKGLPEGKRPTVSELASRLVLRHHTVVELTDRLESAGFVKRQPDPQDGRQILIHVTPQGTAKLRSLSLAHRDELQVKGPELARTLRNILRSRRRHAA